jgi:hypothetical protein
MSAMPTTVADAPNPVLGWVATCSFVKPSLAGAARNRGHKAPAAILHRRGTCGPDDPDVVYRGSGRRAPPALGDAAMQ